MEDDGALMLSLCEANRPDWWEQIKDLPTTADRIDALLMIGLRACAKQNPDMPVPWHLRN